MVPDYETKLSAVQEICSRSDLGQLAKADLFQEVAQLAGTSASQAQHGIEAEANIDWKLVGFIRTLREKHYRIGCLSNGTDEWTLQIIKDYGLEDVFDTIVISANLGVTKPDPVIFHYTLKQLNTTATQAVFVDDRQTNIEAAEQLAIRSLLIQDTRSFMEQCQALLNGKP